MLALFTFGAGKFHCGDGPVFYRMFNCIPGLPNPNLLDARRMCTQTYTQCVCAYTVGTIKNVSRHCQMFLLGQNHPCWRTTDL